jgi:flagellar biosynthesis GTPase FlhF
MPPFDQLLPEESAEMRSKAALMIERAEKAVAKDDETVASTLLLAGIMTDHIALLNKARDERMRPFLTATRVVNGHYNAIIGTLATFDTKGKVIGGPLFKLRSMVDEYRRKIEAEAAAERRRLEEEARKQREAAEAAERARQAAEERERQAAADAERRVREAEEAARLATTKAEREKANREAAEAETLRQKEANAARQRQHEAALAALDAEREADKLQRQAEATTAAPLTTAYGVSARRRTVWAAEVVDLNKALRHCITVDRAAVVACVQTIYDKQVRAGVRNLPGAEVKEESATTIRTS